MANTDLSDLTTVGIDIGKEVFHLIGFDNDGKLVLRKKIKRLALISTFEKFPHCVVGMEACLSAHFFSRTLRRLGFEPRIMPAKYTKPFIKGQKNDYNDAEAIAEAALRPNLRCVKEKDTRSIGFASSASRAFAVSIQTYSDNQSNSRVSDRTRHYRQNGCKCTQKFFTCHSGQQVK